MSILYLPLSLAIVIVVIVGSASALAFSAGLNRRWRPAASDELKDLTAHTGRMLGGIYSLILALAFNTAMSERTELEEAIDEEAVLLLQIVEDSRREMHPSAGMVSVNNISSYVEAVLDEEWRADSATAAATASNTAYVALERLRAHMATLKADHSDRVLKIEKMLDDVERRRLQRLLDLEQTLPKIFWILSILLFFGTLIPMARYSPNGSSAMLIGSYGAAVGLVLYSILLMSEPFQSTMPVSQQPFLVLKTHIEKAASPLDSP
jgi:hypothetical protein